MPAFRLARILKIAALACATFLPAIGGTHGEQEQGTASFPKFGEDGWPDKAHDSIRHALLKGDYIGGWRSVQLLKRVNIGIDYLDYYEKLSAILAGACALSPAPEPVPFDHLLRAYVARFYRKFSTKPSELPKPMDQAADNIDVTSLNLSQTPYLMEIRNIKLLKGQGCRMSRPTFTSEESAEKTELSQLTQYLAHVRSGNIPHPSNDIRVKVRLLELATRHKKSDLASELLNELATLEPSRWLAMSENNRRFLWTMLQENERVPKGVVKEDSVEDFLIEALIKAASKGEVSHWLALAPIDQWSLKRRREIFKAVDNLGPFPGRSAVILRRALIAYEEQKPREALEFVKRILSPQDGQTIDSLENIEAEESNIALTLQFVEKILSEYKYDQAVIASIKTSVPSTHWRRIYRGLLLQYAIRGDNKGYSRLKEQLLNSNSGIWQARLTLETISVLDSMVIRSMPKLSKSVANLSQESRSEFIRLSKDIAVRVAGYSDDEFRPVKNVLSPFIPLLEKDRDSGRQSADTEDVIRILGRFRQDLVDVTERAVHGGVTHAGSANIRPLLNLNNPFVWIPLHRMQLTNLLAMPDGATSRGWSIQ